MPFEIFNYKCIKIKMIKIVLEVRYSLSLCYLTQFTTHLLF